MPAVDKVKEWAKTPEGQRVTAAQLPKVAPDNLRAAVPAAYRAPAAAMPAPAKVAPAKDQAPAAPARDFWKQNKDEITTPKPDTSSEQRPTRRPRR